VNLGFILETLLTVSANLLIYIYFFYFSGHSTQSFIASGTFYSCPVVSGSVNSQRFPRSDPGIKPFDGV